MREKENLLSLSPLDGRYSEIVSPLSALFSEYGLLKYRHEIEIRWLMHLTRHADIEQIKPLAQAQQKMLHQWIKDFSLSDARQIKKIERRTLHDIKAVEIWLAKKLSAHGLAQYSSFLHFGCTSEDINNLAYGRMLMEGRELLSIRLKRLLEKLSAQAQEYADLAMLARTHGQPASPTTLGKELAVFVYRLQRQYRQLLTMDILGKLNGATGNYSALHLAYPRLNWQQEARIFITDLGLAWNPYTTQIESHDNLAEILHQLARLNTVLVDMCRDIWGYISLGYFYQSPRQGQVGSSTMPHKVNPISFENAEGNAAFAAAQAVYLAGALPLSRWQRDLSDSTLLRNLGVVFGHSLLAYEKCLTGLASLKVAAPSVAADLEDKWEILSEAMQTLLRQEGQQQAYWKIRTLSQGKTMNAADYRRMVNRSQLSPARKTTMLSLTPCAYIGLAARLARNINQYGEKR